MSNCYQPVSLLTLVNSNWAANHNKPENLRFVVVQKQGEIIYSLISLFISISPKRQHIIHTKTNHQNTAKKEIKLKVKLKHFCWEMPGCVALRYTKRNDDVTGRGLIHHPCCTWMGSRTTIISTGCIGMHVHATLPTRHVTSPAKTTQ